MDENKYKKVSLIPWTVINYRLIKIDASDRLDANQGGPSRIAFFPFATRISHYAGRIRSMAYLLWIILKLDIAIRASYL